MPAQGHRSPILEQRAFHSPDALQVQNLGTHLGFDEEAVIWVTHAKHSWVFNALHCYAGGKKTILKNEL